MRKVYLLAVLVLTMAQALAQNVVKGKVVDDATGEPVYGASVMLTPSNKGTTTNRLGEFSLENVSTGNYVLKVSMIGFASLEKSISVQGDQNISLRLTQRAQNLQDVIVTGTRATEKHLLLS